MCKNKVTVYAEQVLEVSVLKEQCKCPSFLFHKGKVDVSELSRMYQRHGGCRRRDSELRGAEDLWASLQYLWKVVF